MSISLRKIFASTPVALAFLITACTSHLTGESVKSTSKSRVWDSEASNNEFYSKGDRIGEIGDYYQRPSFTIETDQEYIAEGAFELIMIGGRDYPVMARVVDDGQIYDYLAIDQISDLDEKSEIGLLVDEGGIVREACMVTIRDSGKLEFVMMPLIKGQGKQLVSGKSLFAYVERRLSYSLHSVTSNKIGLYEHFRESMIEDDTPVYEVPYNSKSHTIVVSGVVLGLLEANPTSGKVKLKFPEKPENLSAYEVNPLVWGRE